MKFLADQDVYASTIGFLQGLGHDVLRAAQLGLSQAEDTELLRVAHEQGRIFVTRDVGQVHGLQHGASAQASGTLIA
jgi:predicted nuclease of predicted toxin-antitoxin system